MAAARKRPRLSGKTKPAQFARSAASVDEPPDRGRGQEGGTPIATVATRLPATTALSWIKADQTREALRPSIDSTGTDADQANAATGSGSW